MKRQIIGVYMIQRRGRLGYGPEVGEWREKETD